LTFKTEHTELEPKGDREILSWILDVLRRASIARNQFFRHQAKLVDDVVRTTISKKVDEINREDWALYCAANLNVVFTAIQAIESFHGVLTASDYLARNPFDLKGVRSILLDPTDHQGGVISILQKKSLSPKMISSLTSIPRLDKFENPTRSELFRIFLPCLERFELCCKFSYKYSQILKPVRHVYAHNYRFVFFDEAVPEKQSQFDETVLGFLSRELSGQKNWLQKTLSRLRIRQPHGNLHEDETRVHDVMQNLVFVGFYQRLASRKLISHLSFFETWIYVNMRKKLWNKGIPELPEILPYMATADLKKYEEIRESLKSDYSIPERAAYGKYDKKDQEKLHWTFLQQLQELGEEISMIDQFGNTKKLKFLDEEKPASNE
jgi:hypothetical protein